MIGFLIALVSGALMSIQGVFNTQVTKASGIWTASAFVQFTALLVCLGAWLYGADFLSENSAGGAEIYAAWRCHRCFYYLYGDS